MSKFLPFGEAVAVARSLGLASRAAWKEWCKEGMRPPNVPSNPNATYKDGGWQGWGHWLGTGNQATHAKHFLPFDEALAVARSLGLASQKQWLAWCKEGGRPVNVPAAPNTVYKNGGWQEWGHWLGTGNQADQAKQLLPFEEALVVARCFGLANMKEWQQWCREGARPPNVPANPRRTYKDDGWQGWVHWLGSGGMKKPSKFASFDEALTFAQSLGLASSNAWTAWCKEGRRPPNVPSNPQTTYKDGGWQGWGHWLGTGNTNRNVAKQFLPFREALAVTQSLGLPNHLEWQAWCKEGRRPPNVPSHPHRTYKDDGWQGWGHWLGTGNISTANTTPFLPLEEALGVARSLGLANRSEWRVWCKQGRRPPNVPSNPNTTYKDGGWHGWGHWLGTGNQRTKEFLPFDGALTVAQSLNLDSRAEWKARCKEGRRPPNVPAAPDEVYKDGGWQGWGHWLGTGNQPSKTMAFLPYDEALRVARALRLVSQKEWYVWCRSGARPANVPANPAAAYRHDGWLGWGHWLGTGNQRTENFLLFNEALVVARAADLASEKEWRTWCRDGMRPPNMPAAPDRAYKRDGWRGWRHWLGTEPGAAAPAPALAASQQRDGRKRKR